MQLAITGATGHIGGQVARLLSDQGLRSEENYQDRKSVV